MLRRRYLLPLVAFAALGLTVPATANAAPQHESHHAFPTSFPLPNGFLPEGIAIGPGAHAFFGSRADGDVYRVDLRTGRGKVFSQGPGTPSIGLKSDGKRWLFIAGGPAGNGRVVDIRSGKIVASYQFTSATATFVNDVVLTRDAAWFTDSQQAVLYKVPLRHGKLPKQSDVKTLPLSGDYVHTEGFNANGIAQTPDRKALLIVQSNTGKLLRVNSKTGVAKTVDLGGESVSAGDGLLVLDRTLYVVRNQLNLVAVFKLDKSGREGKLVKNLTDPRFDIPTTVAAFGKRLYLPNARFNTPPTPETPYSAVAVRR